MDSLDYSKKGLVGNRTGRKEGFNYSVVGNSIQADRTNGFIFRHMQTLKVKVSD